LIQRVAVAVAVVVAIAGASIFAARRGRHAARANDVEIVLPTIDSVGGGRRYWEQCAANEVPFPAPWGRATVGDGPGQWKARGTVDDSYITSRSVDIYTLTSTRPPGVCAIASRADGTFDVLCQGTNGKACFWEAEPGFWRTRGISVHPPRLPESELPIVDLVPAAPDQRVQCTECHAGENAFLTHTTANHPTNQRALTGWMPAGTYTPIVPKEWARGNLVLSTRDYPNACLGGCHDTRRGGGRLPRVRGAARGYCDLLRSVTSTPSSLGGMPPSAADCTRLVDCPLDVDAEVKEVVASCGAELAQVKAR
jgi:hypothetical protein